MERHNARTGLRWAADRIDGALTLVEVDAATGRGVIVEIVGGAVRIQLGEVVGGRFVAAVDTTVEQVCEVEAADTAEPVPFADALPTGPRKTRPRSESGVQPAADALAAEGDELDWQVAS